MTPKIIEEARRLRAEGLSYKKIGDSLGFSEFTIRYNLNPKVRTKKQQYYTANKARIKTYKRHYYEVHKAEILAKYKEFRKQYPEIAREQDRKRDLKRRESHRRYGRLYYETHKFECRSRSRKYEAEHPDKTHERTRQWRKKHPDRIYFYNAMRRAKKKNALKMLSQEEQEAIKAIYKKAREAPRVRCYLCGKLIPKGHRHVDHIVPLAKGGKHVPSNLAIVCDRCNLRKNAKLPQEIGLLL